METKIPGLTAWLDILDHLRQIERLMAEHQSPGLAVTAFEVYDIAIEFIDVILQVVSSEHFRNPRKNPGVKFIRDQTDIRGNDLYIKIRYPRYLAGPDATEINQLRLIQQNLISLRRNRSPTRTSKRNPEIPKRSLMKRKRKRSSRSRRRRNARRWYCSDKT